MNNEVTITPVINILDKLIYSIENKSPFSLVRWGDGSLKLIHAYFFNDEEQLKLISIKEGIPVDRIKETIDLWAASANISDFIDSPSVYGTNTFWDRIRKNKGISIETRQKINKWKILYELSEFKNSNYCNPEINFLMCLNIYEEKSLPNILYNKKICIISSRKDINEALIEYNVDVIKIKNNEQYVNSFNYALDEISEKSKDYDLFLVAAGELGRIYTGLIKYNGGRSLDIGSLIDFWCKGLIPDRLKKFIVRDPENKLKVVLTKDGKKYERFL